MTLPVKSSSLWTLPTNCLLLVSGATLLGCARPALPVVIEAPAMGNGTGINQQLMPQRLTVTESYNLAAAGEQLVISTDLKDESEQVLSKLETQKAINLDRALKRETLQLSKEFEAKRRLMLIDMEKGYLSAVKDLANAEDSSFWAMAERHGFLRNGIAWRVTNPDPNPGNRPGRTQWDPVDEYNFAWAHEARNILNQENAIYAAMQDKQLERVALDYQTNVAQALGKLATDEFTESTTRASQLRKAFQVQFQAYEASSLEFTRSVPAVEGASIRIAASPTFAPALWLGPTIEARLNDKELMQEFCLTRGYRLANQTENGKDVTIEYVQWRKKLGK